jgi:hypothetical protein
MSLLILGVLALRLLEILVASAVQALVVADKKTGFWLPRQAEAIKLGSRRMLML